MSCGKDENEKQKEEGVGRFLKVNLSFYFLRSFVQSTFDGVSYFDTKIMGRRESSNASNIFLYQN